MKGPPCSRGPGCPVPKPWFWETVLLRALAAAAAAKLLQLCPTLCDPIDGSLPGSSVHGIFPGKSTGLGCHCLLRLGLLEMFKIYSHLADELTPTLFWLWEALRGQLDLGGTWAAILNFEG